LTILLAQIFLGGLVANAVGSSFLQRLEWLLMGELTALVIRRLLKVAILNLLSWGVVLLRHSISLLHMSVEVVSAVLRLLIKWLWLLDTEHFIR
jgi:hypothetical protein